MNIHLRNNTDVYECQMEANLREHKDATEIASPHEKIPLQLFTVSSHPFFPVNFM